MRRSWQVMAVIGLTLAGCGDGDEVRTGASTTTTTAVTTTTTAGGQSVTTTAAPATTTTGPPTATALECGTVGFTPNSEDAAGDITARGATCDEARAFVRIAGQRTSSRGPQEVDVQGFHCVRTRTEEDPLPQSFYECTDGATTITFVRS